MTQFELMFVIIAGIFLSLIVLKVILEIRKDKPILTEEQRQSLRTKLSHPPIRIQEGLEVGMTGGEWVGVVLCTPAIKQIALFLILSVLVLAGHYYYGHWYAPSSFVSSFLSELEHKGPQWVDYEFFISEYSAKPLVSWEECYASEGSKSSLSKEKVFQIWKSVYLTGIDNYASVSIEFSDPLSLLMTREQFKQVYENYEFYKFETKFKEYGENEIEVTGYVSVKYTGSALGNALYGGEKKFQLTARNGKEGWKIIYFVLK